MNPIIVAIDAGHYQHGVNCVLCKVPYPCPPMLQARIHNRTYVPIPMPENTTLPAPLST